MEIEDNSKIPWVEKYRPKSENDLILHDKIKRTIFSYVKKKNLPNLIFYGKAGTGKTSTIVSCAKELYKNSYRSMVLDLNASDERGIDTIRNRVL